MIRLCDDHLFDADTSDVARLARWLGIRVPSRREGESFGAWNTRVVREVQEAGSRVRSSSRHRTAKDHDAMTTNSHMEDTSISDAETDSATLAARYVLALKEQSEARRQLESRRRWLMSELEIVDKAIVDNTALDPTNLTVAEVTRHILALHSRGALATTIVREVRATKPDVDAKAVHAELRHARKTGTRRNYLYFPPNGSL